MNTTNFPSRYAIYYAPHQDSLLHQLGSHWLGRDAVTGQSINPALPPSIAPDAWQPATDSPRRYGFHATLKPPFKLVNGRTSEDLKDELQKFAMTHQSFSLPRLTVGTLGRFIALILSAPSSALHNLAADAVRCFDGFRAPPDAAALARRMHPSMSLAEQQNLVYWGYPYVLNTWKFHMTLTSSLSPDHVSLYRDHLIERFREVCEVPALCDSICLFEEPAPNQPMLLIARYPLAQ
jgi:putative phosphonate metabolism protein